MTETGRTTRPTTRPTTRRALRRIARHAVPLAIAFALAAPPLAHAQALWLDRRAAHTIQLEILKPDFAEEDDFTFGTSVWYLSGRMEFSPTFHGVAEVPFANAEAEGFSGSGDLGAMFGNPYLGVEVGSATSVVLGEFGLRIPISGEKFTTSLVALYSDTERWPAWIADAWTVRAGVRVRSQPSAAGLWVEGRLAPEMLIAEDGLFIDGTGFWAAYGLALRLEQPAVRGGVGISGRAILDNLDMSAGEATLHQLDVAADFLEGKVRPGVSLRVPLDEDLTDVLSVVYGVSVAYMP